MRGRMEQGFRALQSAEEIAVDVVNDIGEFQGFALRREPTLMIFEEMIYGMNDVHMRKDMERVKLTMINLLL